MRNFYLLFSSIVLTSMTYGQTELRVLEGGGTRLYDVNDSGKGIHPGGYYDFTSNTSTSTETETTGINRLNNSNNIAGNMLFVAEDGSNLDQAAYRNNGVWTPIGFFPGSVPGNSWFGNSSAISENSKYITGIISASAGTSYPFIFDTETSTLTKLTGDNLYENGRGYGVNDAGVVAGWVDRDDLFGTGTFRVPAYFESNGTMHYIDFGTPEYGEASDINNAGQIVGYKGGKAFFYDSQTDEYFAFGDTEDYTTPVFTSISENGIALGYAGALGNRDAIIYHQGLTKPILLKDYLLSLGVSINTFDGKLGTGMGISPDGHFVCGFDNTAPVLFADGWIAYLENIPTEPGCLDAPNGQYPAGEAFIPNCTGEPQTITSSALTGQYSLVQVVAGNQYTFSSSVASDYITISNENGSSILAYGSSSVTWNAFEDQTIRFYTHLDDECNSDNSQRSRIIECGEIPGCEWTVHVFDFLGFGDEVSWKLTDAEGTVLLSEGGYGAGYDDTQTTIAEGPLEFYIESMGGFGDNTPSYTVSNGTEEIASGALSPENQEAIHSDLNCAEETPEGCLDAPYGQYPSEEIYTPDCQGEPEEITTTAWTGEYSSVNVTAGTEYIFSSSIETDYITIGNADGSVVLASGSTPLTWTADADQEIRFYLHLDAECNSIDEGLRSRIVQCGELGTDDLNSFDFSYYPNPVKDVLNFTTKKNIENVTVFNLTGQKVISNAKIANGKINVSTLNPGTYVFRVKFEDGQIETFKIVKK